jgi:predicted amidohydrolase YtcJ
LQENSQEAKLQKNNLDAKMQHADLIITNARIITMNKHQPFAEALAIAGNKIIAVGTLGDVAGSKAKHTRMIDAQMKTVIPGIIEGHVHLFGGAAELGGLMLNNVSSLKHFHDAVSQYREAHPGEAVIVAHAIAHESLGKDGPITRQLLDRIVPDVPFYVNCFDHHTAWANTKALEAAGIMQGRALPVGNEIVLDAHGLATGELKEPAAFSLVQALGPTGGREWLGMNTGGNPVPPATPAQRAGDEALLKKGIAYANSLGITTMHNMDGNWYQLERLKNILDHGELNARMEIPFHQKNYFEVARVDEAAEMHAQYKGDMLWSGRVKIFMDGVMETLTALMLSDYPGHPGNSGAPLFTAAQFNELATRIDRHKLQISVHAIGDGAVRRTLDGFEVARNTNGVRDSRHRIEHIEIIDPTDIPRISKLGVIASLQPVAGYGVPWMPKEPIRSRLGDKLPLSYPWQTIRNSGATVAFSSDWPVASLDPYLGFQAAMTADHFGQHQNLMDTVHSFTAAGAIMDFTEDRKGMLKVGYLADIAVLDADLEGTRAEAMDRVKPVMTVCDGRVVWER